MKLGLVLFVAVVYVCEMALAYRRGDFSRSQWLRQMSLPGQVRMTFWSNWAVSIGLPIMAVINYLIADHIFSRSLPWYDWLFFLAVGFYFTRDLFRGWSEDKHSNTGHIVDENGKYTPAGVVHYIYMIAQTAIFILFIITPIPDKALVWFVVSLFFAFMLLQHIQAIVVQGSSGFVDFLLRTTALVGVGLLKYKLII